VQRELKNQYLSKLVQDTSGKFRDGLLHVYREDEKKQELERVVRKEERSEKERKGIAHLSGCVKMWSTMFKHIGQNLLAADPD
tara:strand:- start:1474 stop:1722 length:249 start_codon:yes stop_codon:yes gene_type:complete